MVSARLPGQAARAGRPGANLALDRAVGWRTWEEFLVGQVSPPAAAGRARSVLTARLLAAIRGLTGQLRPLHAEPVIRWGFAGPGCGPSRIPGRGLPPAGCQVQGGRAMGGDLMAREWDVPGYTGVKTLGSGGFGDVVLARHDASGTQVAIKYLHRQLLADPEFAELFRAEAAVLASLDDPNVVRLYEYVESPAGAAIVMELVDGVSLRDILARQGKTTAEAALVVLQGSLLGLAAAHRRGVVHRDYKPENVLIDGDGVSKLTDFGIAARAGDSPIPAGTLAYAPPEQFTGSPASPATDVYAATATFYECLTGRPPFDGDTAEVLLRQHQAAPVPLEPVPEPLRPLVAAGLAKDPGRRPADGAALVAELRAVAGAAYGPGWEDRGRSGLAAAALLLAALWPSGGPAAVQGSTVYRVRLRRRLPHGKVSVAKAAITAGVVAVGVAVAAGVILAMPTGHPTPAPTPTPARATAPAPAPARATAPAPAPAQWTGTQLAAALLPLSDFPAGYREQLSLNTGALFPQPDAVPYGELQARRCSNHCRPRRIFRHTLRHRGRHRIARPVEPTRRSTDHLPQPGCLPVRQPGKRGDVLLHGAHLPNRQQGLVSRSGYSASER